MRSRALILLAIVLGLAGAAAAQHEGHFSSVPPKDHARVNPLQASPDVLAAGNALYRAHCAECHGDDAKGKDKKPSLRTPEVHTATGGDLEWFLRQGDIRHGMPSWSGLTQAQRWALVVYLRSLQ
jgi:mono/diheme cytochrome c family protein